MILRNRPRVASPVRTPLASVLLGTALSCGGSVVFDPDGTGDGAGGADGGNTGPSASVATVSVGTSGVATTTVGQAAVVATSVGVGGGTANIVPTIESVDLGANCMPVVDPDPIFGLVQVRYDNVGTQTGSLPLMRADVTFSSSREGWVFPVALSPDTSGPVAPGVSAIVEHRKVETSGNASFVCQLCGLEGTLVLRFEDDEGEEIIAFQPFRLGCAM